MMRRKPHPDQHSGDFKTGKTTSGHAASRDSFANLLKGKDCDSWDVSFCAQGPVPYLYAISPLEVGFFPVLAGFCFANRVLGALWVALANRNQGSRNSGWEY
jgi:hypothetical protein